MKKNMLLAALALVLAASAAAQTTTSSTGELVFIKDSLVKFLLRYNFQHYNVTPNLPKEFSEKKEKYEIPADETIVGFIDSSVMRNARFGIAIGLKGMYIFNSKTSDAPGRKFLDYNTFKLSEVSRPNKNEVDIGPVKIEIVGLLKDDQNKAEAFFRDMKSRFFKS